MKLYYDLHIHTCLSPCASNENLPSDVVGMAIVNKLDVIAITDHNSSKNCRAAVAWAKAHAPDMIVLCGMELTTSEEVHVLCLFAELGEAEKFAKMVYKHIPYIKCDEKIFGHQLVVDENDAVIEKEEKMLLAGTDISIEGLRQLVESYGGAVVPAHVDRDSMSLISNLGSIPPEYGFKAIEIRHAENKYLPFYGLKLFDSDAHQLAQIGRHKKFLQCKEKTAHAVISLLRNGA